MDDARLVREVVIAVEPFIMQPLARPIGSRRDGAATSGATDDLNREVINCHNGNLSTLQAARRRDV